MFENLIRDEDIAWAAELMGLGRGGFAPVGGDDSRYRAMLRLDTVDFEACPGSGKTTLLVAKLAVLAERWPSPQQGICVLSHTNAARNEISSKLSSTAAGMALMRYPHFIGTIHSFVNEYLALPWLRSKGVVVRRVDTQVTSQMRWFSLPWRTRNALERNGISPAAMTYREPDYGVGTLGIFRPHTPTNQAMTQANREISEQGFFCFDEMFVWAKDLLDQHPETIATLRRRFPLVFIDEAQDNSEDQSALLHRIFCDGPSPSIRQRFGDSNQAIYSKPNQNGANTDRFPGETVHPMPRSYRFGQGLADHVKGLGVTPQPLLGAGPPSRIVAGPKAPAIFLFDDGSVQAVLAHYGEYLLQTFDETALQRGVFTAIAGVHDGTENEPVPRRMAHYAPNYDPACVRKESTPSKFAQYLARARYESSGTTNTDRIINAAAAALIAASDLAGETSAPISRRSPHRRVAEMLGDSDAHDSYRALQEIILAHQGELSPAVWREEAMVHIQAIVRQLSGNAILNAGVAAFLEAPAPPVDPDTEVAPSAQAENLFVYPPNAPQVRIRLGSIHSVKGETHTATLVLDSYFYRHHLSELKPWILGAKSGGSYAGRRGRRVSENDRMLGRLKLHYVAMTRPTHLLCLAMRKDAFEEAELELLVRRGWRLIDCCLPAEA